MAVVDILETLVFLLTSPRRSSSSSLLGFERRLAPLLNYSTGFVAQTLPLLSER